MSRRTYRRPGSSSAPAAGPRRMTARYRGTCPTCALLIIPGTEIVYAGRRAYHADTCHDGTAAAEPTWKARYGRCEDAPCCGCCD